MARSIVTVACCLTLAAGAAAVASQARQPAQTAAHAAQPASRAPVVNTMCPIGHEAIDGTTFVEVNGVRVGLCCAGCDEEFQAWTAQRKAAFIAEARTAQPAGHENHGDHGDHAQAEHDGHTMPLVFAYYLPNCPIRVNEEMNADRAVITEIDGREVRFCCARCEAKFEADPAATLASMDEMLIKDQIPFYPLKTCLVMEGEQIHEDEAVNIIYKNRLVRFCCDGCVEEFEADPETYLHQLDEAAADAQRDTYPLTVCVVAGHEIADGEEPTEVIVGGRLIRLCCGDCLEAVTHNPAHYVKMIDEARAAADAAHAVPHAPAAPRGR